MIAELGFFGGKNLGGEKWRSARVLKTQGLFRRMLFHDSRDHEHLIVLLTAMIFANRHEEWGRDRALYLGRLRCGLALKEFGGDTGMKIITPD